MENLTLTTVLVGAGTRFPETKTPRSTATTAIAAMTMPMMSGLRALGLADGGLPAPSEASVVSSFAEETVGMATVGM